MIEKVFIKNRKGLKMAIKLNISPERNKLVFLLHGLGARKEYPPHMLVMEEFFARKGFNVVNIDATDSINESESSEEGVSLTGYYEDLQDVIEWARLQDFFVQPFALAGQSLGAQAVVLYASRFPSAVDFLLPVSFCFVDGKEELKHNKRTQAILQQGFYDQVSKSTGRVLRIGRKYIDEIARYNFADFVANITAKTEIIVGDEDNEWHKENCRHLYRLLNCEKNIQILAGVPHDLANTLETKDIFEKALENLNLE